MVWAEEARKLAMGTPWKFEDPVESCRAIVYFIEQHYEATEPSEAIRTALLEDLCSKARGVKTSDKAALLASAMYYLLPARIRELYNAQDLGLAELSQLPPSARHRKSVGIITVISTELDAVLRLLDVDPASSQRYDNFEYWFSEVENSDDMKLSIVISNVGQPRNVPCAIAVDHMIRRYPTDLMMLIGIAAGPADKVELGDVVAADRVYDYEHVRAEILQNKKVKSPRPLAIELEPQIRLDLNRFAKQKLREKFHSVISTLDQPIPAHPDGPNFHRGTIAAGEMLIADGSLDKMRLGVDDEIRGGDQEDSGFVQACKLSEVPWCVFRGISDYARPDKDKTWQFSAALAAASAGYIFLRDCYKPPQINS
jgi:nucleoside phosphorylase